MQKNIYVKDLNEGDRFEEIFLVKSVKSGETRTGNAYFVLTVTDKSGEVSGPIWNNVQQLQQLCVPGETIKVKGSVQSYRDQLQLKIDSITPIDRSAVDLGDFIPAAPGSRRKMGKRLQSLVHSVEDPFLRKLLSCFFDEGEWLHRFLEAPAAKGIHHAYVGGLLEHSLSVAAIAEFMARHYRGVNRSLLIAGALLHDIGKIEELSSRAGIIDYTVQGRLKGHIVMGNEAVARAAGQIDNFPQEVLEQVQHIIVSHHGRREFGSPVLPMTVEAIILSFIDDLDSKINITEQLRHKMEGREMDFTEYQRSLERYLYLGGLDDLDEEERPSSELAARQQTLF